MITRARDAVSSLAEGVFDDGVVFTSGCTEANNTVLLAESHLCLHTWPERGAVTLDVYVCNFGGDHTGKARALEAALVALFKPVRVVRQALQRGAVPPVPG